MNDWIGIAGLVLLLLFISLYGLLKDKDPHSMNPRPYIAKERESWLKFQRTNFVVFVLALVIISLLAAFIRRIWMR
jgi:magnesium-transporting ATPase (P-type)